AVVTCPESGEAVAPASDRDRQVIAGREPQRGNDIGNARAPGDQGRIFVDAAVPDPPGGVVAWIPWCQDRAPHRGPECISWALAGDRISVHEISMVPAAGHRLGVRWTPGSLDAANPASRCGFSAGRPVPGLGPGGWLGQKPTLHRRPPARA